MLEILGGVALAARHPLYDLYGLAVLDHALEAKVYPTIIAAAGRLVGENFGGVLRVYFVCPQFLSVSVGRVPGCYRTAGAIYMSTDTVSFMLLCVKLCCIISA